MASSSMEADMLIEQLSEQGISAYKQGIDGGIMDVYSGNSNKGDYIFVDRMKIDDAKRIIDIYKLS